MASPPPANFQTQSGIRQSLRKLELFDITHRKLTTAFYYLMALPTLKELVFKRLILRSRSLGRLPTTPLRVTSLRFSHCFISPEAVQEFFAVCPSLVNFVHKLEGSFWPANRRTPYLDLGVLRQYLLMRRTTLKSIVIMKMQVPRMFRICAMGSLPEFNVLEHPRVNQLHLMPTDKWRSWMQPRAHKDATQYLLALPSFPSIVKLYHCDADETLSALGRLSGCIPQDFLNLKTLKIRLRNLPTKHDIDTEKIRDEIVHAEHGFERIGVHLDINVVTSAFWQ